ncbi:MAG: NYN domain-containing protein, partial [Chloroflexota bacterium]
MRTNIYVDGFNLYYGLKYYERQGRLYKWLDINALCTAELPGSTIHRIRYCTARVQPRDDPRQPQRQQAYFRALETIPGLKIFLGHFLEDDKWMPLFDSKKIPPEKAHVIHTEEKGSDVNLASLMLCDAFDGDFDLAVLISNDSDLKMPIEIVRRKFKLQVGILNPGQRQSSA